MNQPEALRSAAPLTWSYGAGTDVWAMFTAAMAGNTAALSSLLDRDPGLVRSHYEYRTALYFAVRENQVEAARLLLARGANQLGMAVDGGFIEIARERGFDTMVHLLEEDLAMTHGVVPAGEEIATAIRAGDFQRLRALLDADPSAVHAAERRGNRAIHMAALVRRPAVIDLLVSRGADVNARRGDGARPIQLTVGDYNFRTWGDTSEHQTSPRETIARLRTRGAHLDIVTACHIGDIDHVRALLAADPSLANRPADYIGYYACSGTPLRNAAAAGHMEIVRLLLAHGADPNLAEEHIAPRGHALHAAVCHGHRAIVELLLAHGAYPNVEIESSADTLSAALNSGDKGMVELLCSHGAARRLPLIAYYGDIQTAAAMFAANPALADDPAALIYAAEEGHESLVRLLLRTAPVLASRAGVAGKTRAITELLLDAGMNASHRNWLEITPLHQVAAKGNLINAACLLARGADRHAIDDHRRATPQQWAERAGQSVMAAFLAGNGLAVAERLVDGLLAAYNTGDADTLARLSKSTRSRRPLTHEQARAGIRERLGRDPGDTLPLADARLLAARLQGLETWEELTKLLA